MSNDDEKKLPYHKKGPSDCWLFKGARDEAPNRTSKMACDNPVCCNPRHVVEQGILSSASKGDSGKAKEPSERDLLCAELDKRGIGYRTNASTEKLQELLNEAQAAEAAKGAVL